MRFLIELWRWWRYYRHDDNMPKVAARLRGEAD